MSMPAEERRHEFVVAPELAEVAERLGVPMHAGHRVRYEVIEGGLVDGGDPPRGESWPPSWVGSITTDEENLSEHARDVLRVEFTQRVRWQ